MTTKNVTLKQFSADMRALGPKMESAIVKGLQSAALRMPEVIREELHQTMPHPAIATGELARSTKVDLLHDGAIVGMDAPHAAIIEEGARPHFPPLQPLRDWVRVKGFASDPDEVDSIAYAVAKKISKRGIEPRHYFKASMIRLDSIIDHEIESEIITEFGK